MSLVLRLVASTLLFSIAGCAQGPSYSNVKGETYTTAPIVGDRIFVLASADSYQSQAVGNAIAEKLRDEFSTRGFLAKSEYQMRNSLALGSELDLSHLQQYAPNVVIFARVGHSYSTSGATVRSNWAIVFDLLDRKMKGVWQGRVNIHRPDDLSATSEAIARQVVDQLQAQGVLRMGKDQSDKPDQSI